MAEYLLEYQSFAGDEDADSDHHFEAANNKEAVKTAKKFGRKGDFYLLYKLIGEITSER